MQGQVGIYLVAETRLFRESLAGILRKKPDLCVLGANSACEESLQQIVELSPPILLIDSTSAAEPSFVFLRALREKASALKILVVGGDEDEDCFLHAASAGIAGYVLKDASAADVVAAVRAAAREEAVCPPRLCLTLFARGSPGASAAECAPAAPARPDAPRTAIAAVDR
jgi:DNA-binding NarL/FixJ family response regulator